jgi:hypothetical protein
MSNPYCGWYKNSDTDTAAGSDFDFLQFEENEEINENTQEVNSFKNAAYEKSNERK